MLPTLARFVFAGSVCLMSGGAVASTIALADQAGNSTINESTSISLGAAVGIAAVALGIGGTLVSIKYDLKNLKQRVSKIEDHLNPKSTFRMFRDNREA